MAGISIISNFDLNQSVPLDSRQVVNDTSARLSIQYPYEGLKVYQLSNQLTYLYENGTWSIDQGGIFGGSGSLIGNTEISYGNIGLTVSESSYTLKHVATSSDTKLSLSSYYNRFDFGTTDIEYVNQFNYTEGGVEYSGPYIKFNSFDTSGKGSLIFGAGDSQTNTLNERLRISSDGNIGVASTNPYSIFQISDTNPLSISKELIKNVISSNWYGSSGVDYVFDPSLGSSRIVMNTNGDIDIFTRASSVVATAFTQSLNISKNSISFLADVSSNAWSGENKAVTLITPENLINNVEHRYTKIQNNNWVSLDSSYIDTTNNYLLISDAGNSFDITVDPGYLLTVGTTSTDVFRYATDIKIRRGITLYDVPDGTDIKLRIKHSTSPTQSQYRYYLKLKSGSSDTSTNIESDFDEYKVFGITYSHNLYIEHVPNSTTKYNGDIISLTKFNGVWQVTNVNRDKTIVDYVNNYSVNYTKSYTKANWETSFNPSLTDNIWIIDQSTPNLTNGVGSQNQTSATNSVTITATSSTNNSVDFNFNVRSYSPGTASYRAFINQAVSYDRMFYLYNYGANALCHEIRWYLKNQTTSTWIQVGSYRNGSAANGSTALPLYSHSVFVPAGYDFKIFILVSFGFAASNSTHNLKVNVVSKLHS